MFDMSTSIQAARSAALNIYHRVLRIERDVSEWRQDHPGLSGLLTDATNLARNELKAHGVDPDQLEAIGAVLGHMVVSELNSVAATDPTVQSGGPAAAPQAQVHA